MCVQHYFIASQYDPLDIEAQIGQPIRDSFGSVLARR